MSRECVEQYLASLARLEAIRKSHNGAESQEEDQLLEEMDGLWWEMSESERGFCDQPDLVDVDVRTHGGPPRRRRDDVESGPSGFLIPLYQVDYRRIPRDAPKPPSLEPFQKLAGALGEILLEKDDA